ncbi:hypothetical protein XA68_18557 [Ophiocordyceps unilateralis]|uniref:Uncharacterized protein n=1 Tax=Ophiocordyceps unilateralis TaxID=268505 RepID=A0A2A9PJ71_OPHUN|nr:hypothetical protein XA68_18557 [Ophiocordyceps unilateralis]
MVMLDRRVEGLSTRRVLSKQLTIWVKPRGYFDETGWAENGRGSEDGTDSVENTWLSPLAVLPRNPDQPTPGVKKKGVFKPQQLKLKLNQAADHREKKGVGGRGETTKRCTSRHRERDPVPAQVTGNDGSTRPIASAVQIRRRSAPVIKRPALMTDSGGDDNGAGRRGQRLGRGRMRRRRRGGGRVGRRAQATRRRNDDAGRRVARAYGAVVCRYPVDDAGGKEDWARSETWCRVR